MHPVCTRIATAQTTSAPILQPECNQSSEHRWVETPRKAHTAANLSVVEHKGCTARAVVFCCFLFRFNNFPCRTSSPHVRQLAGRAKLFGIGGTNSTCNDVSQGKTMRAFRSSLTEQLDQGTGKENRHVRRTQVQAAWAAARIHSQPNVLHRFPRGGEHRAGMKKAAVRRPQNPRTGLSDDP